jgi:hypothetical protein
MVLTHNEVITFEDGAFSVTPKSGIEFDLGKPVCDGVAGQHQRTPVFSMLGTALDFSVLVGDALLGVRQCDPVQLLSPVNTNHEVGKEPATHVGQNDPNGPGIVCARLPLVAQPPHDAVGLAIKPIGESWSRQVIRRPQDCDAAPRVQDKQVLIAGHNAAAFSAKASSRYLLSAISRQSATATSGSNQVLPETSWSNRSAGCVASTNRANRGRRSTATISSKTS